MEKDFEAFFPFVFPLFWCAVCIGLAKSGGWTEMAKRWNAPSVVRCEKRYFRSGSVKKVQYSGSLIAGAAREGLYLSVLLPFRPGHTPLLLPWKELSVEKSSKRMFLTTWFDFKTSCGNSVSFERSEVNALLAAATKLGADVEHMSRRLAE